MLTLCIDTAYKYLSLSLIENDEIIAAIDEECFKKQSEMVFLKLDELFKIANKKPLDIDSVCISEGPGSYTGVRIAMTIAKTICEVANLDLYTISTLKLYANNYENTMVIMDARASRAYIGVYDKDNVIKEDCVMNLADIKFSNHNLVGDLSLFGEKDKMFKISHCFLNTKKSWKKVDNITYLVPKYLKESDAYYR